MTTGKRRIEKLETGLTPKQVFMLWLQDAHTFNDIKEYVQSLKDQMESAAPIPRLTDQVEAAVKQRLKGQPKEEIHKAVRQAYKDVLFLFFLHQQVNGKLYTEERYFWTRGMLLLTELKSLMREQALDRRMRWKAVKIALDMPYPLDSETAAAVEAAKEHYVMTWEMLEESDDLGEWVTESFLTNGKNSLPEGAYGMMSGATPGDSDTKDLFQNAVEFQKFLDGEDYSYGLADVTDAEYNAHYEAIVSAVKGEAPEGVVVELPTVPNQFLTDAPLVDGDWIDRYVVELAEWGARMVEKGYLLEVPEDQHPLAWHRIIDPEGGCEANAVVTEKLWQQTRKHISGFPGRTKEIDGRQYLSFTDYLKWRGRHAKGDLTSGIDTGMVVADWNRWVEEHGGEGAATLTEVGVGKLDCHLDGYCFRVCLDAAKLAEEVGRRESLSETVQVGNPGGGDDEDPFRRRVERWKGLALGFLPEIYALRGAIDSINQRYFDGQQILFPAVVEGFDQLVALVEKTVDIYNDSLAEDIERLETLLEGQGESPLTIDRTGLVEAVRGAVVDQVAYLVDMAKAEALDMLGDTRQALKLVNLYA